MNISLPSSKIVASLQSITSRSAPAVPKFRSALAKHLLLSPKGFNITVSYSVKVCVIKIPSLKLGINCLFIRTLIPTKYCLGSKSITSVKNNQGYNSGGKVNFHG
jgi:hypothetical protein